MGTLHEDQYRFCSVTLRTRNMSHQSGRDKCGQIFSERGRSQMTIWHEHNTCWKTKATNTHSQYVTIVAFLLQQWLHQSDSMIRYTYISYPIFMILKFQKNYYYYYYYYYYYITLNNKMNCLN